MPLIEHGELISRALDYIQDQRIEHPNVPMAKLIDDAGMRFNLTPLDTSRLTRLLTPPSKGSSDAS